ncbi:molybdopterin molybdotransferase MoeA [Sagittula sp. SSi028]|uniref:molybdopterin molybdotransferase MoeA n=1 Tax=Sagittula sp. SSi028 TaxID=3400636 RepID=UPI003AF99E6C
MISVNEALETLFSLATVQDVEFVPLRNAVGRVLRHPVRAKRDQPPFDSSVMDGYAVSSARPGERLKIIGESSAGHGFEGSVSEGETVRIFTGAPLPEGATRVVIQEDAQSDGTHITIRENPETALYIRSIGADFAQNDLFPAPKTLSPQDIALLAAMNIETVAVSKRPQVALISTGDELVMPGEAPKPDQIIASNALGLMALLQQNGADPKLLPIAKDNEASLRQAFFLAEGCDLIITIGGASVGDYDLVAPVARSLGMQLGFHKVAMRPGKPLMSGRLRDTMMIGLPGNPVSAMVCGHVFVLPVIRSMLGLPREASNWKRAPTLTDLPENGPREHYMRATQTAEGLTVAPRQDSSLLSVLASSNVLAIRPPHAPAAKAGQLIPYLEL